MAITRREFIQNSTLLCASDAVKEVMGPSQESDSRQGRKGASQKLNSPVFPYGAVYFRKSNPPEQDWARDHATAAQMGMNVFRHWFMWSAIEVAPGKYDWEDYDRMMDLAAQNQIQVIIAEIDSCAPEWTFRQYPHARYRSSDGAMAQSEVSPSSATGGFPGLCLDNPDVRSVAEAFLTALVERYRDHPALLGYDLWNENTYPGGTPHAMHCYCDATKTQWRHWLRSRYESLDRLGKAWFRYSYQTWDDVEPPYSFSGYPDSLDWLQFRIDNAFDLLDWRVKVFRKLDPHHMMTAHGVAGTLETLPSSAHNEWRSASKVDVWGLTWIAARKGAEPWRQYQALDLVRCGASPKPFWHAEAQGGPLWMQPQVIGRPRDDGRIPDPEDVRLWNLVSCAGGASGILYCRWRPLLDGPLFGAFGPFGMDGSVTPQAEMAGRVARWANAHPELWMSHPVQSDMGLVFVPESELFNYVQQGETTFYSQSVRGAYRAFFDSGICADFVALDDLQRYKLVYLPYPVMLKQETVAKLRKYVEQGGTLVSEGLPAYFGDSGHVGTTQPNFGLDEVFGARQIYVEFTPDISDDLVFEFQGAQIPGRYFRQDYELRGGKALGHYANGHVAAVTHTFGSGRTLLIGTFPGAGYSYHPTPAAKDFFAGLLKLAGLTPLLTTDDNDVQARLHQGPGGAYLWITNPTRSGRTVTVSFAPSLGNFASAEDLWGQQNVVLSRNQISVGIPARDAVVLALHQK